MQKSPDQQAFIDRLRDVIGPRSDYAFARLMEISETSIKRYYNGTNPTRSFFVKLAEIEDVDLHFLITGKQYDQNTPIIDKHLYAQAYTLGKDLINSSKSTFTPEKEAHIILDIYTLALEEKQQGKSIDSASVIALFKKLTEK